MKKKLLLFILISIFILPFNVSAKEAFDILKYDVDVKVNLDNTLDITEDITVFFNEKRHGIIRKIPLKNNVIGKDNKKNVIRARISDIKVDSNFDVSTENKFKLIKIGSASEFVSGEKNYKITYKYDLGPDKNKKFDEFYFNVIGTEWNTSINKANITIHMPKEYDTSKFGVSVGSYGYQGSNEEIVDYKFEGNNIFINTKNKLNAYEGVNVRIELPDKYFDRVDEFDTVSKFVIIFQIIMLLIIFLIWYFFGKDRDYVETVEFYPPEGLNSAELAYVYNKSTKSSKIVSLLIYLANKKYLKIEDMDNNDFKIIKLKEYDGNNKAEETFFKGLFKKGDVVKKSDLKNSFHSTISSVKYIIYRNIFKYFDFKSYVFKFLVLILIIINVSLSLFLPLLDIGVSFKMIFIIFSNLLPMLLVYVFASLVGESRFSFIFIIYLLIGLVQEILILNDAFYISNTILIVYGVGLITLLIELKLLNLMERRSVEGTKLFGKIKGFKRFLETAEKNKLEALVLDDPSYFYNILPYTYALDISDKWINKFEDMTIRPAEWYTSNTSSYNSLTFNSRMDSMLNSLKAVSYYSGSSSGSSYRSGRSGGYSGGGGRSGGGFGGGGGSSW